MTEEQSATTGQPYFKMCACGWHGRIVFADGRTSGEIYSKPNGHLVLHYSALVHNFQKTDIYPKGTSTRTIGDQIDASSLPEEDLPIHEHRRHLVETWNAAKLCHPGLDPEDFHKVEDKLWHYRAFDD